jgi:hypothetical protein
MKINIKKIIAGIFVLSLVLAGTGFIIPHKARAILGVGDVVYDPANTTESTFDVIENGITSSVTSALGVKTFTLDAIATAIAKQILQQLTLSVVNWINSGFNGSPAFVTNPAQYFQNIGDEIAGNFLEADGDLRFLCSPFSLDVRVALAVKMEGQIAQKYTCTLSSAIKNATNAAQNASITGFIQGDFSQGGFPALLTLTTDPQNNAGGAFLQAEDDLTKQINSQVGQKTNELNQGSGFLSWQDCTYTFDDSGNGSNIVDISASDYNAATQNGTQPVAGTKKTCTTQTPGSVISATLNKHLAVPTDELELANDVNSIVNALFSQLVLQVLKLGLGAVGANTGNTAGAAYLQQLAASSNQQNQTVIANTAQAISPYLSTAEQVQSNTDAGVLAAKAAAGNISTAMTCWTGVLDPGPTAQNEISKLQQLSSVQLAPLQAQAITADNAATNAVSMITNLQNGISNAQTLSNLSDPSQQLQSLATTNSLPTAIDISNSKTNLDSLNASLAPINSAAQSSWQECQSYIPGT